jgi:hypothetical protein
LNPVSSASNRDPSPLAAGYSADVDRVEEEQWSELLMQFDDANIYQTWTYDAVRCGARNISHLLLRREGKTVALAQARIAKIPLLRAGIAYVRWAPLWRRRGELADLQVFRQCVRALRNEYACRRGLVLRLCPNLCDERSPSLPRVLEEEGFSPVRGQRLDRTLVLDLAPPLQVLRAGLRQHWQRYLKVAERNGLEITEGTGDRLFEQFIAVYREMVARKGFPEPNDINQFRAIQRRLPDPFKMKIMLCWSRNELCAGLISSTMGNTAVYLFGATSDAGLRSRGSYLLHWKLIESLKQQGIANYDLNGIDPVLNPGTYKFKADLCGPHGKDLYFPGRFDAAGTPLSHGCVMFGEKLRAFRRRVRGVPGPAPGLFVSSTSGELKSGRAFVHR